MIKLVSNPNLANAITHSGIFHADDIFSTIFLSKLFPEINLYRAKEWNDNKTKQKIKKIIYDIGYGDFDHHGENAKIRENGIKYSSFGLLFEKYGKGYLKKYKDINIDLAYQTFIKEFILQIDAIDNGIFPEKNKDYSIFYLSEIIEMFNKTWLEEKNEDATFLEAIQIGKLIFERIEKRIIDKLKAQEEVEKSIQNSQKHKLILSRYMPFMEFVIKSKNKKAEEIYFAIFPSNRGGYNIKAINKEIGIYQNRIDFPKEWGGKNKEELFEITKIKTFRFCHPNLFLCSCDTLEDAIKIADLAIKQK